MSKRIQKPEEGTDPKWGDLEDEPPGADDGITTDEENDEDKESAKGSVSKPLESAKGSGTALKESNLVSSTSSSAIEQESSSSYKGEREKEGKSSRAKPLLSFSLTFIIGR